MQFFVSLSSKLSVLRERFQRGVALLIVSNGALESGLHGSRDSAETPRFAPGVTRLSCLLFTFTASNQAHNVLFAEKTAQICLY